VIEAGRLGDEDLRGIHRLDGGSDAGLLWLELENTSIVLVVLPHGFAGVADETHDYCTQDDNNNSAFGHFLIGG